MISKICKDDFSNEKFKFGTGKFINIFDANTPWGKPKEIKIWAQRLSYVGEVGFELYVDSSSAKDLYEILIEEGKNFELSHCGMHAMDIMRMESGFVHWGHDISPEENQYQACLLYTSPSPRDCLLSRMPSSA